MMQIATYTKRFVALGLLSVVTFYSCKTHYKKASENYTLAKRPDSYERGKNLAYNVCGGCHLNYDTHVFIGNRLTDLPKFLGKIYSSNITHSERYGVIPHYTDAQLAYLIKTGIKNDGRFIPYMIRPTMADDDVNDIIVYLRSNDKAVSQGDTSIGHTHLSLIGKIANHTQHPQPYITGTKRPAQDDAVANGRYLVDILGCYHCHSKSILSLNYTNPEDSKGYMQGGKKFKTPEGKKIRASDITQTGIGYYSKEDMRKAIKNGQAPNGRKLRPPMPQFEYLTDNQIDDIYAYLKTLPIKK